jgi:cell filamentation protein
MDFSKDPHTQLGSEYPKNVFGYTDYRQLQLVEVVFVQKRTRELEETESTGSFDAAHLLSIHNHIFRDVFPWAGRLRVVDIFKGGHGFAHHVHIPAALDATISKLMAERCLTGLTAIDFVQRTAFYLGEINAIHPFREGNGRTQREFIRQLGLNAGHPLAWIGFTQAEMIEASILSHTRGDNSALASILERAIEAAR